MTMQLNRGRFDTCDCVFLYEWDDAVPAEERVHTVTDFENKCAHHLSIPKEDFLEKVHKAENVYKNLVVNKIATVIGLETREDKLDAIEFEFDSNRKLAIKVKDLTPKQLTDINAALEADPEIDTSKAKSKLKQITAK